MKGIHHWKENLSFSAEEISSSTFLLAVSGGVDSMVLLHLFYKAGLSFQVAHVNYHLRGEASDLDQKLVEKYCKDHHILCHVKEVNAEEKQEMKSIQQWARAFRYAFFYDLLSKNHLDFMVTAHHLNDALETFFINLSRGSGIKGLCGIPSHENKIIRPLLAYSKEEIYAYAHAEKIPYREDESNLKNDYLRNKIRNQLLPNLHEIFPHFLSSFQESISHLQSTQDYFQKKIDEVFSDVLESGNEEVWVLNKEKLLKNEKAIVVEIIRKFGFTGLEIEKIIPAENGKFFRSSTHEMQILRNQIICHKKKK